MKGSGLIALAVLSMSWPAWAQTDATSSAASMIEQRIEGSLPPDAGVPALPLTQANGVLDLAPKTADALAPDASLAASFSSSRLRTPIDVAGIGQRIDKGATAAGETSAFEPDYAYGAFQRGYFLTAFSLAIERAKAGDSAAQTLVGELLSRGLGVKQDIAAAIDWYGFAAERNDPEALYALGRFYLEGGAVHQDLKKAAEFLQKAADRGHPVAAREFAYMLLQGKGRDRNAMLAAAYLRRSAARGDMDAQYALAGLYVEGVGVVEDEKQAARWFSQAARNGHVAAEIEYAIMLFNGRGVAKDEAVAARWFREAAIADNPVAQIRLARLLAEGRGVERNPAEAARWYLIARDRGVSDDFLDSWLSKLDSGVVKTATDAAQRWMRVRPARIQAASRNAPTDKAAE